MFVRFRDAMSEYERLVEALTDILRRVRMNKTPDIPEFKEAVTEVLWRFKDRGIELDCEFIKKWLEDARCPDAHLNKIISWCRSINKGGPRFHGPFIKNKLKVWADDIWEQGGRRASKSNTKYVQS